MQNKKLLLKNEEFKGIIDYAEAEIFIRRIESLIEGLDFEEKNLVLGFVLKRMATKEQKRIIDENVNSNPLAVFANRFIKGHEDDEGMV